jgi:hypothetical protein
MKLFGSRSNLAPRELSNDVFPLESLSAQEVLIPEIGEIMIFIDSAEGPGVPFDRKPMQQRAERARTRNRLTKILGHTVLYE